ncbi:unnamed protein product, partial [Candidula unifasciata]
MQTERTSLASVSMLPNASLIGELLSDNLVSDDARKLFQWIGYSIVCELIDIFGTVTNIMNIICFIKLGFKESVNVSLL